MVGASHLIEPVELCIPRAPGWTRPLRLAHVSDLHVQRSRRRYTQVATALRSVDVDLILFTGDYMNHLGDEPAALEVMTQLCETPEPRLGRVGVFGNHDSDALVRTFEQLPIRWLMNQTITLADGAIELTGLTMSRKQPPDAIAALISREATSPQPCSHVDPFRLMICHIPMMLPAASDMGIDLMLAGHTHGGQIRLPGKTVLVNSTDLPGPLSSGLFRHGDTIAAVTRGLGESWLTLRTFCPPHLPVYTIRPGPLSGEPCATTTCLQRW